MTPIADTRKRSRDEDMNSDFEMQQPSKRINNSSDTNFSNIEQNEQIIQQQINNLNINSNHHHSTSDAAYNSHSNNYASMQQQQQHNNEQRYSPDLSESENPHYFNRNKLLYDLHMDKLKRADV